MSTPNSAKKTVSETLKTAFFEQIKEIKDLKKANKYYKEKITELRVENQNLDMQTEKLESENKQLKKDLKQLQKYYS